MKQILFILVLISFCFATGNAPTDSLVDATYEQQLYESSSHVLWNYDSSASRSGLDTLTGDDSVKILNDFSPRGQDGWKYVLQNNTISGDSAAVSKLELILIAYDRLETLISHTIVDTLTYTGGAVEIPFYSAHGYFADHYDAYLRVPGSSGEMVVGGLWLWQLRPRQTQTIRN